MKIIINTRNNVVEGVVYECSIAEGLLINKALQELRSTLKIDELLLQQMLATIPQDGDPRPVHCRDCKRYVLGTYEMCRNAKEDDFCSRGVMKDGIPERC